MRRNLVLALCTATVLISSQSNAQTVPITTDDSVPAVSYYSALISGVDQPGVGAGAQFPLTSTLLQPGVLKPSAVPVFNPKWMTQTLAIVGDDKGSKEWLKLHLERLLSLQATVIVVSAASEKRFKDIQRQANALPIVPDSGHWLQNRLAAARVTVYPVLIGLDGKARQIIFSEGFERGDAHEK
ncbi:MAG: integrating conjugative element protein [Alcaligenes aquatilis]